MMIRWDNEGDKSLWLLTPDEYKQLPDGIELESVNGNKAIKGTDYVDQDIRWGHLAFGVRNPYNHKYKDTFLIFLLKREPNVS